MDYGRSFKFVFEDKDWPKKVLIGGVINLIPVAQLMTAGYALRTLKAVAQGKDTPLPEWDDFGGDFVKGLLMAVAVLIYAIPIIGLAIVSAIVGAVAGDSGDGSAVALCLSGIACLNALWGILMGLVLPAAVVQYSKSGEFGAFFRFGDIWAFIKDNLSDYIVAILLSIVASIIASIVGGIACGIGVLFTTFWATLVGVHLLGQIAAKSMPAAPFTGPTYGDLKPTDLGSTPTDPA